MILEEYSRQNLPAIEYAAAPNSGSIDTILSILRDCEELTLTPEQMNVGKDILLSINEHSEGCRHLAVYYLIRYGMMLEGCKPEKT